MEGYDVNGSSKGSYIRQKAKKNATTYIKFIIIPLLIIGVIAFISLDDMQKQADGAIKIHSSDINEAMMTSGNYYEITIGEEAFVFDAGLYEGDKLTDYYLGVPGIEVLAVIEIPAKNDVEIPTTITGKFKRMESDLETMIKEEIVSYGYTKEYTDELIPPYRFNEEVVSNMVYYIPFAILALISLLNLFRFLKNISFNRSRVYKDMQAIGDPESIEQTIEREIERGKAAISKNAAVFDDYIVLSAKNDSKSNVFKKSSVQWCYLQIRKQKFKLITVGKQYTVTVGTADKKLHEFSMGKKAANESLEFLHQYHADCIYGHSQQLEYMWKNENEKFQSLIDQKNNEIVS